MANQTHLPSLIQKHQKALLDAWLKRQEAGGDAEAAENSRRFLLELRQGTAGDGGALSCIVTTSTPQRPIAAIPAACQKRPRRA